MRAVTAPPHSRQWRAWVVVMMMASLVILDPSNASGGGQWRAHGDGPFLPLGDGPFLPLADVLALFSKAITETLGNEER